MDREDLGARLYELRGQAVALARRVLREDAAAEDACAEGYLRALTYPDAVPPPEQLKPWFLRVVLNAAMSRLKSDEARRRREESVMVERRSGRDENASDVAERKEITAVVSEAVQELEEKFRIPIVLRYEHGLSQAEVATVLGDPVGTVASNISRGLEKLRGMLAARGITAAPAVIGGALAEVGKQAGCPAEFGARIKGMIEAHAAREATVGGAAGVPATGAAKGGVMMKVAAVVVLAGAAAGGMAMLVPSGGGPVGSKAPAAPGREDEKAPAGEASAPSEPAKGPPKREHYAFGQVRSYLNGPRLQALTMECSAAPDEAGNLFILDYISLGSIRCVTTEGQVIPIAGNDHWNSPTPENEGPAYMLCFGPTGGFGGYCGGEIAAKGRPLEGGDKGAIYTSGGKKIYKDKNGQWWFKTLTVIRGVPQIGKDGKLYFYKDGEIFCCDEDEKNVVKVLARGDYAGKAGLRGGESPILVGNDGSFYISKGLEKPVVRIWPDKQRVEEYVVNVAHGSYWDGPGTKTGWFCGPMLNLRKNDMRYLPLGVLLVHTADESLARRVKDGRVSTLYPDGEWRENPGKGNGWQVFRDFSIGPDGTAFTTYGGCSDIRTYRFSGIDWGKPTVGPLVERK